MKTNKVITTILLTMAILVTITLSGCTKRIMWSGNDLPGHKKASYKSFTGTEARAFQVQKGQTVSFEYDSKVDKGTLSIKVLDSAKNEVMELPTGEKGSKELKVEKEGKYKLVITGDKTGGSFDIRWKVQ